MRVQLGPGAAGPSDLRYCYMLESRENRHWLYWPPKGSPNPGQPPHHRVCDVCRASLANGSLVTERARPTVDRFSTLPSPSGLPAAGAAVDAASMRHASPRGYGSVAVLPGLGAVSIAAQASKAVLPLKSTMHPHPALAHQDFGMSIFFSEGQMFSEVLGSAFYVAPGEASTS
jgi:hypothetical protein